MIRVPASMKQTFQRIRHLPHESQLSGNNGIDVRGDLDDGISRKTRQNGQKLEETMVCTQGIASVILKRYCTFSEQTQRQLPFPPTLRLLA
jgi:hypothetical protein